MLPPLMALTITPIYALIKPLLLPPLTPLLPLLTPNSLTMTPIYPVTTPALAARVVDAQMPENQFTSAEQSELFTFDEGGLSTVDKAIEVLNTGTKDEVLIQLVQKFESIFVSIEDQGSLLEDKIDEHLNPEQEKEAQADYDREVNPRPPPTPNMPLTGTSDSDYIYQVQHCERTHAHGMLASVRTVRPSLGY